MDEASSKYGILRHVFVDPGYKRLGQGASFSQARVANEVANQWMARARVLHDYVQDTRGQITKVAKQPLDSVPQPNEDVLRQTPRRVRSMARTRQYGPQGVCCSWL